MKKLFDGITPLTAIFFLILTALGFGAKIHQRHHDRKKREHYEKKLEKQQRKDQERYKSLQTKQSQHQLKELHIPENNIDLTDEKPKEGSATLTIENLFIYPTINDSSQQSYLPKEEPIDRPDPPSESPPKENATLPQDNQYPLGAGRNYWNREKKN